MTTHAMSCTEFDELLADYLEGDLEPAQRLTADGHVASCVRCTALVRDLQQIRDEAGELGELTPSRNLWSGIASRIEAPVVPLTPRVAPNVAFRSRVLERLRLAAVAAALVVVTAGVTYTLTNRARLADRTAANVAAPGTDNAVTPIVAPIDSAPTSGQALAANDSAPTTQDEPDAPNTRRPSARSVRNSAGTSVESSSSREIDRLRAVFLRNRSRLDPRTAAIIEANLKVIDDAIAQSKAALAQDPASRFLNDQLNNALDKKLDLLRTVAQLPSRT